MSSFDDRFYTDDFDQEMLDYIKSEYSWDVIWFKGDDEHLKYGSNRDEFWTFNAYENSVHFKYLTKQQFKEKIGMIKKEIKTVGFTKNDLKTGMLVVLENGMEYTVMLGSVSVHHKHGDIIVHKTAPSWHRLSNFNQDLSQVSTDCCMYSIVAVYLPSYHIDVMNNYDTNKRKLLWEREKPKTKLTVEEIEAKLGYKVEIISGES